MKSYQLLFLFCVLVMACTEKSDSPVPVSLSKVIMTPLTVVEGDMGTISASVNLRLSVSSTEVIEVFVETEDDTALAGEDYVAVNTSVVFAPGNTQKNVTIGIIGDQTGEEEESFVLRIVKVNGGEIQTESVVITIEDEDVQIPSAGYTTPNSYDGMSLIWSDDFSGTALDENYWTFETGNGDWGWGNNELEFYRRPNTSLINGNLVIAAREENVSGFNYTSSRIKTQAKFEFQYGRVDIRAVMPEGQGLWPALWMLGANITDVGWPTCGEIDIMELVGHEPSKVHATVHYNSGGNHQFRGDTYELSGGKKFNEEFHVFSLEWKEDEMKFYVDDVLYNTRTKDNLGSATPYPFNAPFFLIFNVAVGGQWPGSPDSTTSFPQHMIVDYIRVFQNE